MIDFFKQPGRTGLFGPEVVIVGPHHSLMSVIRLLNRWKEKGEDPPFIISINRAVNVPVLKSDLWMVADRVAVFERWFDEGLSNATVARMFSLQVIEEMGTPLDDNRVGGPKIEYTFHQGKTMSSTSFEPMDGILRPNGTIFCQALQACYHAGVIRVWTAGIAFSGNQYCDGTVWHRMQKTHWLPYIPICNNLIKFLETKRMTFRTLTPTKLDIEMEHPDEFCDLKP